MKKIIIIILCLAMLLPCVSVYANADEPERREACEVFTDVDKDAWYYKYVNEMYYQRVVNNHIYMTGTSETTFEPNRVLTREEAVTIVFRRALKSISIDEYDFEPTGEVFDDVPLGKWYTKYVEFAYALGMIEGIGDNKFGTGQPVTRQDFAVMIYNLLDSTAAIHLANYRSVYEFKDYDQIADYAREAMRDFCGINGWSIGQDAHDLGIDHPFYPLFVGYNGYVYPTNPITRAQTACILTNFITDRIGGLLLSVKILININHLEIKIIS